ncbi:MAG: hypothetical protein C5B59_10650 [Bacteroidetes bacterium]|nr:MAG: hypothetical protein C5B59_10650 [Bacteroidota bacterium]
MHVSGNIRIALALMLMAGFIACRQSYSPPATKNNPSYLVVDGFIHAGQDSTTILLSRTRNLDSPASQLESGANVTVIGVSGENFPLQEKFAGKYVADHLDLNSNELYQLRIATRDGKQFLSDYIPVKISPPIDSLTWTQDTLGVHIYVNTHDQNNNSWYYRWDYIETWKYTSGYQSLFDYINGQIILRPADQYTYYCYLNRPSTDIQVASSIKLSKDIIYKNPIIFIPQGSEKISVMYSSLVKQYVITKEAYDYWQALKKNSEQLGTLFDAQPTQIAGNMHCSTNPEEPVLGFVSAGSSSQLRIFVSNVDLSPWFYTPYYGPDCGLRSIPEDSVANYLIGPYPYDYSLLYKVLNRYQIALTSCVDCRVHGGVIQKPFFWP